MYKKVNAGNSLAVQWSAVQPRVQLQPLLGGTKIPQAGLYSQKKKKKEKKKNGVQKTMCLKLEWMLYICSICSPNLELLINPPLLAHPVLGTQAVGL